MESLSKEFLKEILTAIERIQGIAVATIENNDPLNEIKHRDRFKDYSKTWEKISEGVNKLKQSGIKIEHPNPFKDIKELYGYLKTKSGTWAGRRQIIKEYYGDLENQIKDLLKNIESERGFLKIGEQEIKAEGKKIDFFYVIVKKPGEPIRNFPFFISASTSAIIEGLSEYGDFNFSRADLENIKKEFDNKRKEKITGLLFQSTLKNQRGIPITLKFTKVKSNIKIFISYAKEDLKLVKRIYNKLKEEGYDPWLDEESLVGGQDWENEITKAIEECNFFLACLSKSSVSKRGYFQKELKKGMDVLDRQPEGRIYLIPVRLDECQVPTKLNKLHWVNFFDENGEEQLLKAIETGCKQKNPI